MVNIDTVPEIVHLLLDARADLRDAIHFGHWRRHGFFLVPRVKFSQLLDAERVGSFLFVVHPPLNLSQANLFIFFFFVEVLRRPSWSSLLLSIIRHHGASLTHHLFRNRSQDCLL